MLEYEMMLLSLLLCSSQQQQLQHSQQQMQQMQQMPPPPQHSPTQNSSSPMTQHSQPQAKQAGVHHLEQQPQQGRPQTLSPHAESIWGTGTPPQASPCKFDFSLFGAHCFKSFPVMLGTH